MKWYEVTYTVSEEASEALVEQLIQLGAFGIACQNPFELQRLLQAEDATVFVDPDFFDELGQEVQVRAYFCEQAEGIRLAPCLSEDENPFFLLEQQLYATTKEDFVSKTEWEEHLRACLQQVGEFLPLGPGKLEWREIKEEDWANNWKQFYHAIEISPRLLICPTWLEQEEGKQLKQGQKLLRMDPGSAFGTGGHETTLLCLRMLDALPASEGPTLDLGCGSGILALACHLLGWKRLEAVDIDSQAVEVAKSNFALNACENDILCYAGTLADRKTEKYQTIVANLLAEVLESLEAELFESLEEGGTLICSGVVSHKAPLLDRAFAPERWTLLQEERAGDWLARRYQKKGSKA